MIGGSVCLCLALFERQEWNGWDAVPMIGLDNRSLSASQADWLFSPIETIQEPTEKTWVQRPESRVDLVLLEWEKLALREKLRVGKAFLLQQRQRTPPW